MEEKQDDSVHPFKFAFKKSGRSKSDRSKSDKSKTEAAAQKPNFYDNEPSIGTRDNAALKKHFKRGMTAFIILAASILLIFLLLRVKSISEFFSEIAVLLRPVIFGVIIAFILNPLMMFLEKWILKCFGKISKNERKAVKAARVTAVFLSVIIGIVAVIALFVMLIPQLAKSLGDLFQKLPGEIDKFMDYLSELRSGDEKDLTVLEKILTEGSSALGKWLEKNLFGENSILNKVTGVVSGVTTSVIGIIRTIIDAVIGIIVAIYVLIGKEQFLSQGRKLIYAAMKPRSANITLHILRKANSIFNGFIVGKLIDSAIIGVLCFIGVSILRMPYALLVSVFVGVTNIIPCFGPFIGAVPSAILITIVDPMKGLYFVIFIILLQQLDGNVIGPKILGNSTGLSAFWVLFAILLFGGLFGLPGMIIGVPVFALIVYVVKLFFNNRLEKKRLPVDTAFYNGENYIDDEGNSVTVTDENAGSKTDKNAGAKTDEDTGAKTDGNTRAKTEEDTGSIMEGAGDAPAAKSVPKEEERRDLEKERVAGDTLTKATREQGCDR